MPRLAVLIALVLALGCTKHEAPPDPLTAELRAGIAATLAAMGDAPLADRALDDEALRLAWTADRERLASVREGRVGVDAQAAAARGLVRRIRSARAGVEPPRLLAWMAENPARLDQSQRLLLEAASEQAERELPKQ